MKAEGTRPAGARTEREILDARARQLARPAEAVALPGTGAELLFLSVGAERLAIDLHHVLEVRRLPEITAVPELPEVFLGVVNHQGEVLPVVDLLALLGYGRADGASTLLVVLGERRPELGLAVDEAEKAGQAEGHRPLLSGAALLHDPRLFLIEPPGV